MYDSLSLRLVFRLPLFAAPQPQTGTKHERTCFIINQERKVISPHHITAKSLLQYPAHSYNIIIYFGLYSLFI